MMENWKMKTRYKIAIIAISLILAIFFIPPNTAAFSCNTLQVKDVHCHVVGMTFFGLNFDTSIYHWFGWAEPLPCGGINAIPGMMYPCIGIADYCGYPAKVSEFSKISKNEKRTIIEGELAEQICAITGGECPPYYIGNPQEDGSVMVGITISDTAKETSYLFFIKDNTLSHEIKENER